MLYVSNEAGRFVFLKFWQCLGTSLAVPVNLTLSNREVFE